MGKRQPTQNMQKMYEAKKADTLSRIRAAIHEMKDFGEPVTKAGIMKMAGVSSGTLSKPYVVAVLKEEKVCQFATVHALNYRRYQQIMSSLTQENAKLKSKIKQQDEKIVALTKKNSAICKELKSTEETVRHLRGQQQMLSERLVNAGVPLGTIRLVND